MQQQITLQLSTEHEAAYREIVQLRIKICGNPGLKLARCGNSWIRAREQNDTPYLDYAPKNQQRRIS